MEHYIIKGGNPLVGDVTIGGAKNAALGILAASIMTDEDVLICRMCGISMLCWKQSRRSVPAYTALTAIQ